MTKLSTERTFNISETMEEAMDKITYRLDKTAVEAMYSAQAISQSLGIPIVTKEVFFVSLFVTAGSPMRGYAYSKGVTKTELAQRATELLDDLIEGGDYIEASLEMVAEGNRTDKIRIDQNIEETLDKAMDVANRCYNVPEMGILHLARAFWLLYEDVFMRIMRAFDSSISYGEIWEMFD